MKIKLIIFLYTLFYNSSSFAISDAAVSALFGGLLYALIFGVGFGICYYIFTNIFGFFKKAADHKSINNLNQLASFYNLRNAKLFAFLKGAKIKGAQKESILLLKILYHR